MDTKKLLLLVLLVIVLVGAFLVFRNTTDQTNDSSNETGDIQAVEADPIDTVMDFYSTWLNAVKATDADPYTRGLLEEEILSQPMRERIQSAQADFEKDQADPVLCTTVTPEGFRTKVISREPADAQILMLERGDNIRALAVVTLTGVNGAWQIVDINCDAGEEAPPQGEFSFEKTGFLLGPSVQPPLDATKWYIVYAKDGLQGFTAVLNFIETSTCTDESGSTFTCGNEQLRETMEITVQGDMQETGVDVVNLTIVDDRE